MPIPTWTFLKGILYVSVIGVIVISPVPGSSTEISLVYSNSGFEFDHSAVTLNTYPLLKAYLTPPPTQ